MHILIISAACSKNKNENLYNERKKKVIIPSQRFFNTLANGLASIPNVYVTCLSALPMSRSTSDKKYFAEELDSENGINFIYMPFKNGLISRYISIYKNTQKYVKKWILKNKNNNCFIITDITIWHCAIAARIAASKKVPTIACVTDLPLMQIKKGPLSFKRIMNYVSCHISNASLHRYDGYILLTESMKNMVSKKEKPYIVTECMVDDREIESFEIAKNSNTKEIFIYAGGIEKRYGIEEFVNAFEMVENSNVELWLYGSGDYVNELEKKQPTFKKTFYKGCVSSNEIFQKEKLASFLVNPRPTSDAFTMYSFPSKTIEYIMAGRPVISTRLPGIPKEYEPFIIWFNDSNCEEYIRTINSVVKMSIKEREEIALKAYEFCKSKTGKKQASRIVDFLKDSNFN